MSRFFSEKYKTLDPYTPGEQPKDMEYVKLNTNESPFPPSPKAVAEAERAAKSLQLYPDPECTVLTEKLAGLLGVSKEEVIINNGSDEVLNFAFMAFCDQNTPAVFADITYGFYPVFAKINGVPYREIPLREDFTVDVADYTGEKEEGDGSPSRKMIVIANPNAPTGLALPLSDIERIVAANPDNVVVVDEAYVDFGGESAVSLIKRYDNLLVTGTFSKSRSMAGARLGFGVGDRKLIADLNAIKYSTNPYNINRMTAAAGIGVLEDEEYTRRNCRTVTETREETTQRLWEMGFETTRSRANFIFARHVRVDGETLYLELKKRGVLVRHFKKDRISQYIRITVGSREQMKVLTDTLETILEEIK